MSHWLAFLYLGGASIGVRMLFWLIGRWLTPIAPEPVNPDAAVPQPRRATPPRPPIGDYRGQ